MSAIPFLCQPIGHHPGNMGESMSRTGFGKPFLSYIIFLAAIGLVNSSSLKSKAYAALISINDPQFGSNSVTVDTITRLQWLDLTKSTGISYNTMLSLMATPSSPFSKWRYATYSEVRTFWQDAGIPNIGSSFTSSNLAPVTNLIQNYTGATLGGFEARGLTSTLSSNPIFTNYQPKLTIGGFSDTTPGHGGVISGPPGKARADLNWIESGTLSASYLGSWLVRTPTQESQVANVVTAVGGAYQRVYGEQGSQRFHTTYQQAMDCATDLSCSDTRLDSLNQSARQQFQDLVADTHNAATSSVNFALSTPPDISIPGLIAAGVTGQLTDILSNVVSFLKWLATGEFDPPVSILDGSATGYHIDIPGLSYDFYNIFVTAAVDLDDLSTLLPGDQFFTDQSIFNMSLPGFGWGRISDISLANGTATFEIQSIEIRSVLEPSTLSLFVVPLTIITLIGIRRRMSLLSASI
jgi:hypothetical protein